MKRLQRAVNNKDKDIQIYKGEFESNKKALEALVKETKENMESKSNKSVASSALAPTALYTGGNTMGPTNHSMMATWDKREGRMEMQKHLAEE